MSAKQEVYRKDGVKTYYVEVWDPAGNQLFGFWSRVSGAFTSKLDAIGELTKRQLGDPGVTFRVVEVSPSIPEEGR